MENSSNYQYGFENQWRMLWDIAEIWPIYWGMAEGSAGTAMHFHYQCEIIYLMQGQMKLSVEESEYPMRDGDLAVIFPMQKHSVSGGEYTRMTINFTADSFPEYKSIILGLRSRDPVFSVEKNGELDALLRTGFRYSQKSRSSSNVLYRQIAKGFLHTIIGECLLHQELQKYEEQKFIDLQKLIQYCSENYYRPLSLDAVAHGINMSRSKVSHLFSSGLHMSFYAFTNMFRISAACHLMETTAKRTVFGKASPMISVTGRLLW